MASGTAPTTRAGAPPVATGLADATGLANAGELLIDRQLTRARRHVKAIELGVRGLWGAVGAVVYFLLLVLIDHWLFDLGIVGRWLALAVFVGGMTWYVARHVVGVALRAINPLYVARAIEEVTPSLKNSLVNYLFLRPQRANIQESIYRAIQHRAATDVGQLEVESTIDHGPVFKLAYVFLGIIVLAGAYKMFSPKDPFPTVRRVLAPWSAIARPARVEIADVSPGDTQAFQGEFVTVSARVRGIGGDDTVTLVYSTEDGQTVDRRVPLEMTADGLAWQVRLPPESDGLRQSIHYRLVAGDALSPVYRVDVRPAPLITVERVEYDYPPYMGRPRRTADQQGDLSGWEGTRVTLHARANQPIRSAWIEFEPPMEEGPEATVAALIHRASPPPADRVLHMQVDGQVARQSFFLERAADRRQAKYGAYTVRFVTTEQQSGARPVVHRIEVLPDVPPEVEIVAPADDRVELAADGELAIDVRAVDPDFAITRVALEGRLSGTAAFDRVLVEDSRGIVGQVVRSWKLVPAELDLQPGDQLTLTAVADDNRSPPPTFSLAPNQRRSRELLVEITAPTGAGRAASADAKDSSEQPGSKDEAEAKTEMPSRPMPGDSRQEPGDQPAGKQDDSKQGDSKQDDGKQGARTRDGGVEDSAKPDRRDPSQGKRDRRQEQGRQESGEKEPGTKDPASKEPASKETASKDADGQAGEGKDAGGKGKGGKESQGKENGGDASPKPNSANSKGTPSGKPQEGDKPNDEPRTEQSGTEQGRQMGGSATESSATGAGKSREGGAASGESRPGGGQPGEGQPGEGQPGEGQPGEGQPDGAEGRDPAGARGKAGSAGKSPPDATSTGVTRPNDGSARPNDVRPGGARPQDAGQPELGQPDSTAGDDSEGGPMEGPSEPLDDGEIFEKALEHLKQQSGATGRSRQPGASPKTDGAEGAKGTESADQTRPEQEPSPATEPRDKPATGSPKGSPKPERSPGKSQGAGKENGAAGSGAKSGTPLGPAETKPDETPGESQSSEKQSSEGQPPAGAGKNGESGAGDVSKQPGAAPTPLKPTEDSPKTQSPDGNKPVDSPEASAPSMSKKQSDSKGGQKGDQSGGGQRGGGQGAKQAGNDSAGNTTSADQGAGASPEQGAGDPTGRAGAQQKAPRPTGQSGKESGPGSGSAAAPGSTGGADKPDGPPGGMGDSPGSSQGTSSPPPAGGTGGGATATGGGGIASDTSRLRGAPGSDVVPEGAEANLDYARRATDLVLEHLSDQADNPDEQLLRKLGWTQDDLRQFVTRWRALKQAAQESDPNAQRELNESLRSLGLRPTTDKRRVGGSSADAQRDYRDAGARSNPPSKYQERFDAFRRGTAR